MPCVSIVIPTHNRGELLMQTLASVRAQTFTDFECIIVDDHSTDDTLQRIAPLLQEDNRFSLAPSPRTGAQAARNTGIERSHGTYVMLLDSDDLLAPFCLEQRVPLMEANPSLDFLVFPCECFKQTPGDTQLLWNVPTNVPDFDRFLTGDVPWQTTSPIWRRDAILSLMPWPEEVLVAQDWEFHIRALLANLRYECVGTPDHFWRMAESERESIGRRTMKPEMLTARVKTNERVLCAVKAAGRLDDPTRQRFAGMFLQSAERLGTRVSWRQGLAVWKRAYELDLISARQVVQGQRYFWLYRFKALRAKYRSHLQRVWPGRFFVARSGTYLNSPIKQSVEASV